MLSAKDLLGRRPPSATPDPVLATEPSDLEAELATAQAELEAAQHAQSRLYSAAQDSKANVAHLIEQVRANRSLVVDGVDAYGSEAFARAKALAEYDELKIEAGVRRLQAATMAERRVHAGIFAREVAATLPALDAAIDAAVERSASALEGLRTARDTRERFIVVTRQRASNMASPEDHIIQIGLAGLRVAGVKIENRDVAGDAFKALGPALSDLQKPMAVRGAP